MKDFNFCKPASRGCSGLEVATLQAGLYCGIASSLVAVWIDQHCKEEWEFFMRSGRRKGEWREVSR